MKRIFNYVIIAGLALLAYACTSPENPTPTQMGPGNWTVDEFYVNGQSNGASIIQRMTLERDFSFILEDNNSIIFVGTWATANNTSLTLTADDGTIFSFTIVFMTYDKMQVVQTISSPTAGDIEIRYLMNRADATTY